MVNIVEKIDELKSKHRLRYPCNSNRASSLGDPCLRKLVYERTHWDQKALPDVNLQYIFDEGNLQEQAVIRDLMDAGFVITEQQRAYDWKKYNITGRIDGKISMNGEKPAPFEIKSMSPFIWDKINTVEDLINAKQPWLKKYPAQMQVYLLLSEEEQGVLILKNKTTGRLKQIEIILDYVFAESLLKIAEAVNKHIADNLLPDRIEFDDAICSKCNFAHICLPDIDFKGAEFLDSDELEIKLNRREELKPVVDEYNELDKEIKETVKEKPKVVIGNWLIEGKWVEKKEYTVKAGKYWNTKIVKAAGK